MRFKDVDSLQETVQNHAYAEVQIFEPFRTQNDGRKLYLRDKNHKMGWKISGQMQDYPGKWVSADNDVNRGFVWRNVDVVQQLCESELLAVRLQLMEKTNSEEKFYYNANRKRPLDRFVFCYILDYIYLIYYFM